jgi:hypothetical protein
MAYHSLRSVDTIKIPLLISSNRRHDSHHAISNNMSRPKTIRIIS